MSTYPMRKVEGEHEVPRERLREGAIEVQHLQQLVPLDHVQVGIGKRSDIRRGLAHARVLPKLVAEDVALAEDGDHLFVLDDLQRAANDEPQCVDGLAGVVEQVARRGVVALKQKR